MTRARVIRTRAGELLLARREDGPLGERWDLPRGAEGAAIEGRLEDERDAWVAVCADARAPVDAPLAWHAAGELARRFGAGEVTLSADAARVVRGREGGAVELAAREGGSTIELAPGVRMMAVRTPTLPPAEHTNLFVIGGRDAVLVEPATPHAEELDRVAEWVGALEGEGIRLRAILATHHHVDHVGGARALGELLEVPLVAHAETDARLPRGVRAAERLADGARIELDGPERIALRAVLTPGHAPGHLCFFDEGSRVMIAGDMVAGIGTILVEPGDGDMALYLESLRRMAALDPSALAPAHGGVLRPPRAVLERYVEHRLAREQRVLEALRRLARPASPADLLPDAYADAPKAVWPLAALSTEAHLLKLQQDGHTRRTGTGSWVATT